jgi:hypothetical protein
MSQWIKSPESKYGGSLLGQPGPASRDATAQATVAPQVVPSAAGILSPKDPMFWFAVIAAGGVALMAYSTYVPVVG